MTPRKGPGFFRWEIGGHLGSQIGGTAWLILMGFGEMFFNIVPGLIWVLCGVVPNVIGTMIWNRRDRIAPYPATQILLAITMLAAMAAMVTSYTYERWGGMRVADWDGLKSVWLVLLILPVIMVVFHFLEMNTLRKNQIAVDDQSE